MIDALLFKRAQHYSVNRRYVGTSKFMFSLAEEILMREHGLVYGDHHTPMHERPILTCPLCQVEVDLQLQAWREDGTIVNSGRRVYLVHEGERTQLR